jgi:SAM-dependent methyltransferase/alpha-ketoglutarate-dependent taurine dioxygenase
VNKVRTLPPLAVNTRRKANGMSKSDDHNLLLVESIDSVDRLNAQFYGRFPYPWSAVKFDYLEDPYFQTRMLNQEMGEWGYGLVRRHPKIWVAGCGTNQAAFTALRFPKAKVIASDVSTTSLKRCADTVRQLGISNLELREQSINQVEYEEQFDYVICTGVIHHNADPQTSLNKLAAALKPTGILELMVYNRFHWTIPAAFQKAVRLLGPSMQAVNFEEELVIARDLLNELPKDNLCGILSNNHADCPESMLADELLQPVLYSYTVESLAAMAGNSNLEILLPCLNQFDKTDRKFRWNMEFQEPRLKAVYEELSDTRRWQVTNLLLREKSPQLWFYLQRTNAGRPRKTERQISEEFLNGRFIRTATTQRGFIRQTDGTHELLANTLKFPIAAAESAVKPLYEGVDGQKTMRELFQQAGIEPTFANVNSARLTLTTPAFPYLQSTAFAEFEETAPARMGALLENFETSQRKEERLKRFRSVKPVSVNLDRSRIVNIGRLLPDESLPLLLQPGDDEVDLIEWALNNRDLIETHAVKEGALLFRGFGRPTAEQFARFAQSICAELLTDNGEHQRELVERGIYSPVFYPQDKQIIWHNENSYNYQWPTRIFFCCVKPPLQGGQTPIVDSRRVFAEVDAGIKEQFISKGVKYVRTYGDGAGLDWQTVFQTTNRVEVERRCRESLTEYRWLGENRLQTSCVRPAVVKHPRTGELTWFNQAQHWHTSCLDQATRAALQSMFPPEEMPRNCSYGDGSPIQDHDMEVILKIYGQLQVQFDWQAGDVLLLDNLLTAHGRNQYEGERKLLVAMGMMLDYGSVSIPRFTAAPGRAFQRQ